MYVDRYAWEFNILQERLTKQSKKSSHSRTKQLQGAQEITSKCDTNNSKDKTDSLS